MPSGSHVRAIALNIGDTSASDTGLAGYLDNVQVATGSGTTTYDFDVNAGTKDDCKSGGWALYGFANQGGCVSWVQANPHAGKERIGRRSACAAPPGRVGPSGHGVCPPTAARSRTATSSGAVSYTHLTLPTILLV